MTTNKIIFFRMFQQISEIDWLHNQPKLNQTSKLQDQINRFPKQIGYMIRSTSKRTSMPPDPSP